MSPAALSRARLARLLREIQVERQAMARIGEDLVLMRAELDAVPPPRGAVAVVAIDLHAFYTALESLFDRIARAIDGETPGGEHSHRALLSQMAADLTPMRPPVIDGDLEEWLRDLLSFRHFFRHAYAVDLDPIRLREHVEAWAAHRGALDQALDESVAFLERARDTLPPN